MIVAAFIFADAEKAPVAVLSVDSQLLISRTSAKLVDQFKKGNRAAKLKITKYIATLAAQLIRKMKLKDYNIPKAYEIVLDVEWM